MQMPMFNQPAKPKQPLLFTGFDPSAWMKGAWKFDLPRTDDAPHGGPPAGGPQMPGVQGGNLMKMFANPQAQGRSPASKGFLEMLFGK